MVFCSSVHSKEPFWWSIFTFWDIFRDWNVGQMSSKKKPGHLFLNHWLWGGMKIKAVCGTWWVPWVTTFCADAHVLIVFQAHRPLKNDLKRIAFWNLVPLFSGRIKLCQFLNSKRSFSIGSVVKKHRRNNDQGEIRKAVFWQKSKQKMEPFLKNLITGSETGVTVLIKRIGD